MIPKRQKAFRVILWIIVGNADAAHTAGTPVVEASKFQVNLLERPNFTIQGKVDRPGAVYADP
jgi:hypothetical protein